MTHFTITKKHHIYLHLGSWNVISHKPRTPADIWSSALSIALCVPRVCTSLLGQILADVIGLLGVVFNREKSSIPSAKNDSDCSASCASSYSENSLDATAEDDKPNVQMTCQNAPNESE